MQMSQDDLQRMMDRIQELMEQGRMAALQLQKKPELAAFSTGAQMGATKSRTATSSRPTSPTATSTSASDATPSATSLAPVGPQPNGIKVTVASASEQFFACSKICSSVCSARARSHRLCST